MAQKKGPSEPRLGFLGRLLPLEPFSLKEWQEADLSARFRKGCDMWAASGFGTPVIIHLFYILKIACYLWLLQYFLSFSDLPCPGSEDSSARAVWLVDGFQRFVTLSLAFEGLGLGCGSGPLSAHFLPPFTAAWHWFTPGTIKLPWRFDLRDGQRAGFGSASSFLGGTTRGVASCAFNVLHFALLVRALVAPRATAVSVLLPVCCTLAVLAVNDATLFLASRSEHYLPLTLCSVVAALSQHRAHGSGSIFSADLVGGAGGEEYDQQGVPASAALAALTGWRVVQIGIWGWAAVSKWGPFFDNVIQAMASNSPLVALISPARLQQRLRSGLYRDLTAGDFRPSSAATALAKFGTCSEIAFPLLLACGGLAGVAGLVIGVGFHVFILSNVAIGVPQEWNVFCIAAACFLFGPTADPFNLTPSGGWAAAAAALSGLKQPAEGAGFDGLRPGDVLALPVTLLLILATSEVLVPLVGNLSPRRVSFLMARRYYAGNWAGSVWLVHKSAWDKLQRVRTASAPITDQLRAFYGEAEVEAAVARLMGFRALHCNSRILPRAIPQTIAGALAKSGKRQSKAALMQQASSTAFKDYQYMDGEFMAAWALGYNFGEGYFHGPFMLQAVQDLCMFDQGECLQITWDSISIFSDRLEWFARDAVDLWSEERFLAKGVESVRDLCDTQPYQQSPQTKRKLRKAD